MIGGLRRGVNITPETSFRILKSAPLRSQKKSLTGLIRTWVEIFPGVVASNL
jgi:hypothetical protein